MLLIKVIRDGANEQAGKDSVGVGCVPKLGRTGRIEFGSEGVPPHVLLRGHFRAQIGLSAQVDKRPQAPSPDFNRQVLARNANLPPNWNAPVGVGALAFFWEIGILEGEFYASLLLTYASGAARGCFACFSVTANVCQLVVFFPLKPDRFS